MAHRKTSNQKSHIDWYQQRLGRRPDDVVAAELTAAGYECTVERVYRARCKLGIAKFVPPDAPLKGANLR